jgi:hypothetical protein
MKNSTIKKGILLLIINLAVALIYLGLSSVRHSYLQQEFISIFKIASLSIRIPLYWFLGALVSLFIVPTSIKSLFDYPALTLQQPIIWLSLAGIILILFLCLKWKKLNHQHRSLAMIFTSLWFNLFTLESLLISMTV